MKSKFIFTRENRWLKKYCKIWKKRMGFGTYILIGPSGSGKSMFLKQLIEELGEECCRYTGQEIGGLLLKSIRDCKKVQVSVAPVMIFEDINCLIQSASMKKQFESFIRQYQFDENGEKRLLLMTAIDFMACQLDGYAIPINPLSINWKIIRRKAKEQQVRISIREMCVLSECKRISELESEIRNIKARKCRRNVL